MWFSEVFTFHRNSLLVGSGATFLQPDGPLVTRQINLSLWNHRDLKILPVDSDSFFHPRDGSICGLLSKKATLN
jgi:hypothetical protein